MKFVRAALLVGVTTLTVGLAAYTSTQAQSGPMGVATYDGTSFYTQSPETQALFVATWGANAPDVWANEHNARLLAQGFQIPQPQPQVVAQPVDQSGAQVSDDNDNESNDNNRNDNR